jgi:ubiquinone/menaquinone biosynthesis C-methylase UbiE
MRYIKPPKRSLRANALRVWWLEHSYRLFDVPFALDRRGNPRHALARQIPQEPLRILDLCCGPGNSALAVAQAHARATVVGADLSPHMLAVARGRMVRRGLHNVHLCQTDAGRLPFADGVFDAAMISFGLHELDPDVMLRALSELSRVLKPGGRLYIVDFAHETGWLRKAILGAFVRLVEPPHMPWFLGLDWAELLGCYGLRLESSERFAFSQLSLASKAAH